MSFTCSNTSCFQPVPTTTTVTTMVNVSRALTGPTACVALRLQESTVKHVGPRVFSFGLVKLQNVLHASGLLR